MPNQDQNQININSLMPGSIIFVKGKVKYSHITKHVNGVELQKANERRIANNGRPITKPYTTITITEAEVMPKEAGNLSTEEQFVKQKLYINKENLEAQKEIYDYQSISKSPYLPRVTQCDPQDPSKCDEIMPQGELAVGLSVILVLRIYSTNSQGYAMNGLAMDGILLQEPVKYYSSDNFAAALATRGLTLNALADNKTNAGNATAVPPAQTPDPNAGIPAPAGDPFSNISTPNPMPTASAPAMNPPVPSDTPAPPVSNEPTNEELWSCPECGNYNPKDSKFCPGCGHKKPEENNENIGLVYAPETN